jgi:hypothetical protein
MQSCIKNHSCRSVFDFIRQYIDNRSTTNVELHFSTNLFECARRNESFEAMSFLIINDHGIYLVRRVVFSTTIWYGHDWKTLCNLWLVKVCLFYFHAYFYFGIWRYQWPLQYAEWQKQQQYTGQQNRTQNANQWKSKRDTRCKAKTIQNVPTLAKKDLCKITKDIYILSVSIVGTRTSSRTTTRPMEDFHQNWSTCSVSFW